MNKRKTPPNGSLLKLGTEIYTMLNPLGEGAFGEVLLIVPVAKPDVACALKRIPNDADPGVLKNFRKEFLLQKRISNENDGHENVIRVMGARTDHEWHNLVLEYANGGELFDKIEPDVGMPPACAQFFFRQLITGLQACHAKDVVHRDIKPENLLLTANNVLKISDFGMATLFRAEGTERMLSLSCGTIPYAAPEVIRGGKYRGPPIDVWSAGVVLITMLTGELPWERASDASMSYLCWLDNSNLDENPWKKIDVRGLFLLRKMLTDNTEKRATIGQIKQDPWFCHSYGRLETSSGRPLKRRLRGNGNDENSPNIACTQQVEMATAAKRRHMDSSSITPNEKSVSLLERQNASFSQPTYADDLLLTQHIDLSQNNTNLMQRMVCRMTRFCVNLNVSTARHKVAIASEHSGFSVRQMEPSRLLVAYREVSMMVNLYTMGDGVESARVMIDFRRSRGDGIQFKKMFIEVRNRMHDFICPDGNDWLTDAGFMPTNPKFVNAPAETVSISHIEAI